MKIRLITDHRVTSEVIRLTDPAHPGWLWRDELDRLYCKRQWEPCSPDPPKDVTAECVTCWEIPDEFLDTTVTCTVTLRELLRQGWRKNRDLLVKAKEVQRLKIVKGREK